jgi:Dienelactone hydrolase family
MTALSVPLLVSVQVTTRERQLRSSQQDCQNQGRANGLPHGCPVVGSFGGADRSPLGARAGQRLDELLTQFDVPMTSRYPGVHHRFMNDHAAEDQTLFLRFLARISGTRYDKAATVHARRRIVAFFNEHLRSDARPLPDDGRDGHLVLSATRVRPADEFDFGLDLILDGLEQRQR